MSGLMAKAIVRFAPMFPSREAIPMYQSRIPKNPLNNGSINRDPSFEKK